MPDSPKPRLALPPARRIWAGVLMLVMLLPVLAMLAGFVSLRPFQTFSRPGLRGVTVPAQQPALTAAAILDRSYLRVLEDRLAFAMGRPRAALIRLNNGIEYVFGRSTVPTVEIGLKRQLYEKHYVDDWCERPPFTNGEQFRKLGEISERVKAAGKTFLVVISPSKAAIYPETLPPRCRPPSRSRAYDTALVQLRELGITVVDTHPLFLEKRKSQPWPLFGRDGTHWNELGAGYATEAVFDRLRTMRGQGPQLSVRDVVVDRNPGDDGDIGDLLNLPVRLRPLSPHPVFDLKADGPPPSIFIVGTSFNWGMLAAMSRAAIIDRLTFIFYFNRVARYEGGTLRDMDRISRDAVFPQAFASADVMIVEMNEANLDLVYIDALLALVRQATRGGRVGG